MTRPLFTLLLMAVFWPQTAGFDWLPDQLVVWNVGQGQWATLAIGDECLHFDLGGERFQPRPAAALCRGRRNHAYFSHWDLDHVNFASRAAHVFPGLCVAAWPGGSARPERRRWLTELGDCKTPARTRVAEHTPPAAHLNAASTNESSRIFTAAGVAFPGDAGARTENRLRASAELAGARVLLLGHHGSRTSSSERMLDNLKALRLAIASARHRRYGHPHPVVLDRLRARGIPVLTTEDWGNVRVRL